MKKLTQTISLLISYTLIFLPLHAASIQTDGSTNTTLDKARNDIPVVIIANPNASGLSHNKFREFNVNKEGLILNNSRDTTVNTQLGGFIFGNKNLTSNAKVILNEVTSTSRTKLNGYTEVAGQRADLVIANPNGLSVNGAGFINTSSVTLSTGTPIINSGNLESFNILGGDINIEGNGLDAMSSDSTYIYTHFLKLNAEIHAKNLEIKLGKNNIDYASKQITASTNSNEVALLLDASALGSMYANRISLVGTDKGLGVNLPPEVLASTGEIYITNDGDINLQKLKAKTNINIDAKDSNIQVTDTITSGIDITLKAKDISNDALINSSNDLTIISDNLTNNRTIFSGNDTFLYIKDTLINSEDASILSVNNITMSADNSNAKTNSIQNISARIETLNGDISIYANDFINKAATAPIKDSYVESSGSIGTRYMPGNWRSHQRRSITIESLDKTGYIPSTLISGNDIYIDANTNNEYSLIAASGNMTFLGSLLNTANLVANKRVRTTGYVQHCDSNSWPKSGCSWYHKYNTDTTALTLLDNADSTIQAGGSITAEVSTLVNSTVTENEALTSSTTIDNTTGIITYKNNDATTTKIVVPTDDYGDFVKTTDPASNFLIETNPEFALYENFISSDYMMSHIDYDSQETSKKIGDALYENTLIRESVFSQTGRRFLNSEIKSDNEQFTYLMDNAIVASKSLELSPGISLSKAQVDALTQDIVWMEEKVVQGEKVLVPVVYIANANNFKLEGARIVAGDNIKIIASDNILNTSGDIVASKDIDMKATNDIVNISANIKAKNINLTSTDANVVNKRSAKEMTFYAEGSKAKTTLVGKEGQIIAANTLNINAAKDIDIQGSKLQANDINLDATNVNIITTVDKKDFSGGDSDNYIKEKSTTHLASNINANNININATDTSSIKGSNLNATNDLNVKAKKIDILAVNNSTYRESKESSKEFFSSESTTTKKATSSNIASTLSGANIELITTKDDIDVVGSKLDAKETLALNSAKDINIDAGYKGSLDESHTKKSGFFTGGAIYSESEDLEGKLTKTAVNSQLDANSINLNSNNALNIKGSNLQATNNILIDAKDINILNATNEETTYSKHTKLSVGLGDVVKSITSPQELVSFENGKLSATLATATYDDETKRTTKTTISSSNLDAKNINLNATSVEKDSGNVLIQASNLKAKEDITVIASNDITIKEAKETTENESKEVHGKAELKVSVKNEYVQIAYSLQAVKQATSDLERTKKDYDNYKDEVSKQEGLFNTLKQDYENEVGFIELADVEEFEELLDDLKEDDTYYKANILLATTTLVTKTTALLAQGAKAAASSGTYGFNAGIELDIDAIEKQLKEYEERSIASNIEAENINLNANNTATIQGSNLQAKNNIDISAKTTDILASKDMSNSKTNTEHKNINLSFDVYGGPSASVSSDSSKSTSQQIKYTNSNLQANNININTKEKTSIKGATIKAEDSLAINTTNLEVASVQNSNKSKSNSNGMSIGVGASGLSSVGVNSSDSNSNSKQTVLTSLTGNKVDINTDKETKLRGATISAVDAEGKDNSNLNLKTETLIASSLNNRTNSNSKSLGIKVGGKIQDNNADNISLDYSNNRTNSKTKTLATLGSGNIQIQDKENSETKMLNTDVANNEVDIYNISSHKGLKGELDTRLVTSNGRAAIANDFKVSSKITDTIQKIVTTEDVGMKDFFSETDFGVKKYEAYKQVLINNPDIVDKINNPNTSDTEKQIYKNQILQAVNQTLGIQIAQDVKVISTNEQGQGGKQAAGFITTENGTIYSNDKNQKTAKDTMYTLGHELAGSYQKSQGIDITTDRVQHNNYQDMVAQDTIDDISFLSSNYGLDINLNTVNNYNTNLNQVTSTPSVFNSQTVNNNIEFSGLDKEAGDNRQLTNEELIHIKTVSKDYATQKGISVNQAYTRLYNSAMYAVDKDTQSNVSALTNKQQEQGFISASGDSLSNINGDVSYLKNTSEGKIFMDTYYESMNMQNYFTATPEQLNNSNYQPDSTTGMEDNSFMLFPTVRVATKVVGTTAIIGKATASKADDVILNTGIKTDNLIQNKVVPAVKDGYYRTSNLFYTNPIKVIGGIDTVYGGISSEPPVTGTQLTGNIIKNWVVEPVLNSMDSENE